jgi:hypothetical protein
MQKGFLKMTIGGRRIEHVACPHPSVPVDLSAPAAGVLHTIEGSLGSGLSVFQRHFAPHFALDSRRIVQMVPLGMIGTALNNLPGGVETNRIARVQIELAGNSKESPWLPEAPLTEALADLIATVSRAAEIPLTRPFPDRMPPKPWATPKFARRHAGKWGSQAGWFGHVDLPENEHWDPGALKWKTILDRATEIMATVSRVPSGSTPRADKPPDPIPDWFWTWLSWHLGEGEFKDFEPHDMARRPELPFGGEGQPAVPPWAWNKAKQFTAARNRPHP